MPETPDPSEVPSLSTDEAIFQRDENGDLTTYSVVVEFHGGVYRSVEFEPTPAGELQRLEQQFAGKEDIEFDELIELMDEKVCLEDNPDPNWEDGKPKFFIPIMEALMVELFGDTVDGMAAEVEEELEERRAEAAGN